MSQRVMIFIDGANLSGEAGSFDPDPSIDFDLLASCLVRAVSPEGSYEGTRYYCSVAPEQLLKNEADRQRARKRNRFLEALEYKRGYTVKGLPKRRRQALCPACGQPTKLLVEKGVDIALATDMTFLGIQHAYDVAVLVTNDGDFRPVVEFLSNRGKKIYHAQFNPTNGRNLRRACFASVDLADHVEDIRRSARA